MLSLLRTYLNERFLKYVSIGATGIMPMKVIVWKFGCMMDSEFKG